MTRSIGFAIWMSAGVAARCVRCRGPGGGNGSTAAPPGGTPDAANFEADAPPGQPGPHPFGTHGGYVTTGVIFPSNHSQAELDAATAADYDTWKATYLVPGCNAGEYRIKSNPST